MAATGDRFNGCQDTCAALEQGETFCRDGGPGSFSPALCAYGTSCALCGPRQEVRSTLTQFEGDDSCVYANDNVCQDGRPSTDTVHSSFVVIGDGVWAHICGYLTDKYVFASNSHFPNPLIFSTPIQ